MGSPRNIRSSGPLAARLQAVPSKSDTHRALIAAAMAAGESFVANPLRAEDTDCTAVCLQQLGATIRDEGRGYRIRGFAGKPAGGAQLELRESGTSFRLLTAIASLGREPSRLDGAPRLRERPIAPLAEALRALGAQVESSSPIGGLPLQVGGKPLRGGYVSIDGSSSSQYTSALLLAASGLGEPLRIAQSADAVSRPYVEMTLRTLRAFGGRVEVNGSVLEAHPQQLRGIEYRVEGDYSTASYPLAAAAVVGGSVRVDGLQSDSAQADRLLLSLLERLGGSVDVDPAGVEVRFSAGFDGFDVDLSDAPDLAPTVAVLALAARGTSTLRGVAHLRHKESDRLALLARNLNRLGRTAHDRDDRLVVEGSADAVVGAMVETASDHRMAMAFAVAGLRFSGVAVDDAGCVAKSNPGFWEQLEAMRSDQPPA